MDSNFGAVAVKGEPVCEIEFSICSLMTKPHQYRDMVRSFRNLGFDDTNSEYLYVDNTLGNSESAYSGLNRLARFARGEYLVFCHQDVVAIDGPDALRTVFAELTERDPSWAIVANAGCYGDEYYFYLNEPNNINVGPDRRPSVKVTSVDENLIILKREAQIGFSTDLDGFHLYGTDLVTQAYLRGRSAYVADFRVEHTSSGNVDSVFYDACLEFERKYARALAPRRVLTTCTSLDVGATSGRGSRDRLRYLKRGIGFERPSAKFRKVLRGWATGYSVELRGQRFQYPRDIPVAEFKSLKKGRFERARLKLIDKLLPVNVPNVVLGASYGILCGLAGQKLAEGVCQVAVEQNPDLMDLCRRNSTSGRPDGDIQVFNRVISCAADTAQAEAGEDLSGGTPASRPNGLDVPGISLGRLLEDVALDGFYSLICDIGGAELDLLEHDKDALSRCCFLLMTLHPRSYYQRNVLVTTLIKKLEAIGFEIVEVSGNHIAAVQTMHGTQPSQAAS